MTEHLTKQTFLEKVFNAENLAAKYFEDFLFQLKKSVNPDLEVFKIANQHINSLAQIPDSIVDASLIKSL